MDIYRDIILDHAKHPKNFGRLPNPDAQAEAHNISCGDRIGMDIQFAKKTGRIAEIRFWGEGCAISTAAASMITLRAKGAIPSEIANFNGNDVLKLIGVELTPTRVKCAVLPLEVLQKALVKWSLIRK